MKTPFQGIGFLKIDVEGGELEVFKGMKETLLQNRFIIIFEVLDYFSEDVKMNFQDRNNELYDFLNKLDYSLYSIDQKAFSNDGKIDFRKIKSFPLQQWTPESRLKNDYIAISNSINHEFLFMNKQE